MNSRDIMQTARQLGIRNYWILGDPASGQCEVQWRTNWRSESAPVLTKPPTNA